MSSLKVASAFIKRDFLIAASYKAAFVLQVGGILLIVPMFYFVDKVFAGSTSNLLEQYGGNYFSFAIIGVAFMDYHATSIWSFNVSIRESQLMGTLEILLLSPTPLSQLVIFSSLWAYLFTTLRFLIYILVGWGYGLDLEGANFVAAVALLIPAVIAFASVGMILASVIMVIKRGESIIRIVNFGSLLLGGVIYPTTVFPGWLEAIANLLPITHALHAMRLALIEGYSTAQLVPHLLTLTLFCIVLVPLGLFSFWTAVHWAKSTGTVAEY